MQDENGLRGGQNHRETANAAKAFEDYYNQGSERTLAKLHRFYQFQRDQGVPVPTARYPTLKQWSADFGWKRRIIDRDREATQELIQAAKRKRLEASNNRQYYAKLWTGNGMGILQKANLLAKDGMDKLSVQEARHLLPLALRMTVEGIKIERLELGEVDVNVFPPRPFEEMTDEELDAYLADFFD